MRKSTIHSLGAKAPPHFLHAPEEATGNAGNTVLKISSIHVDPFLALIEQAMASSI